jgi:DNA-binding beta-propeller fold protein YncE
MLAVRRFIPLPVTAPTLFDHGAYAEQSGRVFIAHTSANCVEVLDAERGRHLRTMPGFTEAAGIVAGRDTVVVTNRGAATLSIVRGSTLACEQTIPTGVRPNGVAFAPGRAQAVVACVGTEESPPVLQRIDTGTGRTVTIPLPGRPRWCVLDAAEEYIFCAIREPSMVLVVSLADFRERAQWTLPSAGAHGIDIDQDGDRLFIACDGGSLVALDIGTGSMSGSWPLPGVPDATFFNPVTGRVHVAIGSPGAIVSVNPDTGATATLATEDGAKTTALARPNRLFVFLPQRGGALELVERAG